MWTNAKLLQRNILGHLSVPASWGSPVRWLLRLAGTGPAAGGAARGSLWRSPSPHAPSKSQNITMKCVRKLEYETNYTRFRPFQTGVGGNNEGAFLLILLRRLTWSLSSWQHPESETQPPRCQCSNYPPSIFTRRRWRNWSVCLCPTSRLTIATQKIKLQHFPSDCD